MTNQEKWQEIARIESIQASRNPYMRTTTIEGRMAAEKAQSYLPKAPAQSLFTSTPSSIQSGSWTPARSGGGGPGLMHHLAAGAWWFVERVPPLCWLKELSEWMMRWPAKYSWSLAAIGSLAGLVAGPRMGDNIPLIVTVVAGAIAGRILIPVIAFSLILVAGLSGLAIVLALLAAFIAGIIYLFNHLAH
jgi:hypothetical protein